MRGPIYVFKRNNLSKFFVLLCALSCSKAQAAPAPFGFELGKATLADIEAKYSITEKSRNAYLGYNYTIEGSSLPLEGVLESTFICDDEAVLQGVVLSMDKEQFDDMFRSLSKKYQIRNQDIPFVGSKKVTFENEDCLVILNAPHMSFNMKISYVTKKLRDTFNNTLEEEKQAKQSAQEAVL